MFEFNLGQYVDIDCSKERGQIIARAEYIYGLKQYLIRYTAADGRAVECWWGEDALVI